MAEVLTEFDWDTASHRPGREEYDWESLLDGNIRKLTRGERDDERNIVNGDFAAKASSFGGTVRKATERYGWGDGRKTVAPDKPHDVVSLDGSPGARRIDVRTKARGDDVLIIQAIEAGTDDEDDDE